MSRPTKWFTPADVAGILKYTPKTIREWCKRGIFPGAQKFPDDRPTSTWRIPSADVEALKRDRAAATPIPRDRLDELMDAALAKAS